MSERFNGAMLVAAVGGVLLIVSLFLDWYPPGLTGWDTFELADLVLGATGIAAIIAVVRPLTRHPGTPEDIKAGILFYAGLGTLIITATGLIQPPPAALDSDPEAGAWLALAGAILVTGGALLAKSHISIVITSTPRNPAEPTEPRGPTGPATEPEGDETDTRPLGPAG